MTFFFCSYLKLQIIGNYPTISDEYSYVYQAELLSKGRLYVESPKYPEFFHCLNIINDGKWYSRYTIGWPLLLAPARIIGLDHLVTPLFCALTIVILYLLAKKFSGPKGGFIASMLALLSPFFLLLGTSYFPHTASGFFVLSFIYFTIKTFNEKDIIFPVFAGFSIAMLLLVRPVEAGLILIGTSFLVARLFTSKSSNKDVLLRFIPVLFLFLTGLVIAGAVNYVQTGSAFTFAFLKYCPDETWGFGHMGHTPLKGLWNTAFYFMRLSFWTIPFILVLTFFSLFRKDPVLNSLLITPLLFVLFYFAYFGIGGLDIGVRYYYVPFLICCTIAPAGLFWLKDRLTAKGLKAGYAIIPSVIICLTVFAFFSLFPSIIKSVDAQMTPQKKFWEWFCDPPEIKEPAILFVRDTANRANAIFIRNMPDFKRKKIIYALYLEPSLNDRLLKAYPDRRAYVFYMDKSNNFVISPVFDNTKCRENFESAAMNYWTSVCNLKKTEEFLRKSLEYDPENYTVMEKLARLLAEQKRDKEAVIVLSEMLKRNKTDVNAGYLLAKSLGRIGRKDEAVSIFNFIEKYSNDPNLAGKARNWAEYYMKN